MQEGWSNFKVKYILFHYAMHAQVEEIYILHCHDLLTGQMKFAITYLQMPTPLTQCNPDHGLLSTIDSPPFDKYITISTAFVEHLKVAS